MIYEEVEELAGLIDGWGADGAPLTLACAQDVMFELGEVPYSAEPEILVIPHYEPGQWKLTRHDACEIWGQTIEDAVIVSHGRCTILAQNG